MVYYISTHHTVCWVCGVLVCSIYLHPTYVVIFVWWNAHTILWGGGTVIYTRYVVYVYISHCVSIYMLCVSVFTLVYCDVWDGQYIRVYIPLCVYIYVMCVWDIYIGDAPLRTHDTHTHYSHYSRGWYIDVYDIYICCIYIYVMCGHSHTVYIVCPVCWAY